MASKIAVVTDTSVVQTKALTLILGISDTRIRQLSAEGWFKPVSRGRWVLAEVCQGYILYLKEENKTQTRVAGENRLRDARAKEVELRVAKSDRTVIELSEAQDVVDKMSGTFLQSIVGLPARITRNIDEKKRIEKICDSVRKKIANRFAEIGQSLQTGVDPLDAIGEEDS